MPNFHVTRTASTPGSGQRLRQDRGGFNDPRYGAMVECMDAAIAREKQLKRWHRDWKCNLIERQNPEWNDLAPLLGIAEPLPSSPSSC